MTNTKHPPGPWRIDGQPRPMTSEGRDLLRVDIIGATLADAALIAVAPDLLAALEGLYTRVANPDGNHLSLKAAVSAARAAIARVKGESK